MNLDTLSILVILFAVTLSGAWFYFLRQSRAMTHKKIDEIARQHSLFNTNDEARLLCRAVQRVQPNAHAGLDYIIAAKEDRTPYISEWRSYLPRPSDEEIGKAMHAVSDDDAHNSYDALRRAHYPSVGDQLDAAYQARQGDHAMQLEIDKKIAEVKRIYAKPDECD
jgi:hypothetical protein